MFKNTGDIKCAYLYFGIEDACQHMNNADSGDTILNLLLITTIAGSKTGEGTFSEVAFMADEGLKLSEILNKRLEQISINILSAISAELP